MLNTQLFFFTVLVVCLFINHSPTTENDGISFYTVYHLTIPLIVPGFCVGAYGMWRTAMSFESADVPAMAVVGLRVVSAGLVLLLVTPFNKGTLVNWTHMAVGVLTALGELAVCGSLVARVRSRRTLLAFGVTLIGGVLAAASLPDWPFHYLLQSEIVFEIGFSWCLVEWTYALQEHGRWSFVGRS